MEVGKVTGTESDRINEGSISGDRRLEFAAPPELRDTTIGQIEELIVKFRAGSMDMTSKEWKILEAFEDWYRSFQDGGASNAS